MSISNLEIKWISFTKKLRNVGVLLIFVLIPYLALVIIPIQFFLIIVALRDVDSLNHELNDPYLKSFRSKYLTASIFKMIGSILVHVGAVLISFSLIANPFFSIFYFSYSLWTFVPIVIPFIVGFGTMIIGSVIEIGAWDNLKLFIFYNKQMFPDGRHYDTTSLDQLRSGALSWALGFLIITIVIGWIIQLIGYFGLSKVTDMGMKIEPIAPPPQEQQPVSDNDFCPMCGASVSRGASYCTECGVKKVK